MWKIKKKWIFSKNWLTLFVSGREKNAHFRAHYLFWPKIFFGPKQCKPGKTIKKVVSAEIAQNQKWHLFLEKGAFVLNHHVWFIFALYLVFFFLLFLVLLLSYFVFFELWLPIKKHLWKTWTLQKTQKWKMHKNRTFWQEQFAQVCSQIVSFFVFL